MFQNKVIIFDLDGTLIDSAPDIHHNLNLTLSHFGFPLITQSKVRAIIGHGARSLVKDSVDVVLDDSLLDKMLEFYNNCYTNCGSPKTQVYDGVLQTLNVLKNRGYILCICTNKPQQTTDEVVKRFFPNIFNFVCGFKHGGVLKPDERSIFPIIEKFNISVDNCFMVGDMETDFLTAKNSGCKSISVLWGYGQMKNLISCGACVFAKQPIDLLEIID